MSGVLVLFFFFKQKTAYEMRISDWSSDVCSSDLVSLDALRALVGAAEAAPTRSVGSVGLVLVAREFLRDVGAGEVADPAVWLGEEPDRHEARLRAHEIGRASCRERVCQYV